LIPKLYPNPKIKSQDAASRRKRPDGRTRRSHAPKRVASRHHKAAETRPKPRFRGNPVISREPPSWTTSTGTLPPSAPINTPCSATEKSVQSQRAKSRVLGFLLSCSLGFLFFFNFYVSEGEGYVESDTDVCFSSLPLYQVIKVTFLFMSLLYFPFCFLLFFYFYLCWFMMSMQVISKAQV